MKLLGRPYNLKNVVKMIRNFRLFQVVLHNIEIPEKPSCPQGIFWASKRRMSPDKGGSVGGVSSDVQCHH